MNHARRLALTAGLAATLGVAVAAQPASAHAPSATGVIYNNTANAGICVRSTAVTSYDHTAENSSFTATTLAGIGGDTCNVVTLFPPGQVAVRLYVQKWNASTSTWVTCRSTPYVYNTSTDYRVSTTLNLSPRWPNCDGTANDGPGYFRTRALSYAWDGDAWRGGGFNAPWHKMPYA